MSDKIVNPIGSEISTEIFNSNNSAEISLDEIFNPDIDIDNSAEISAAISPEIINPVIDIDNSAAQDQLEVDLAQIDSQAVIRTDEERAAIRERVRRHRAKKRDKADLEAYILKYHLELTPEMRAKQDRWQALKSRNKTTSVMMDRFHSGMSERNKLVDPTISINVDPDRLLGDIRALLMENHTEVKAGMPVDVLWHSDVKRFYWHDLKYFRLDQADPNWRQRLAQRLQALRDRRDNNGWNSEVIRREVTGETERSAWAPSGPLGAELPDLNPKGETSATKN